MLPFFSDPARARAVCGWWWCAWGSPSVFFSSAVRACALPPPRSPFFYTSARPFLHLLLVVWPGAVCSPLSARATRPHLCCTPTHPSPPPPTGPGFVCVCDQPRARALLCVCKNTSTRRARVRKKIGHENGMGVRARLVLVVTLPPPALSLVTTPAAPSPSLSKSLLTPAPTPHPPSPHHPPPPAHSPPPASAPWSPAGRPSRRRRHRPRWQRTQQTPTLQCAR